MAEPGRKEARDPAEDPQPYDIWLIADGPDCPAVVHRVSKEAGSMYFQMGDGAYREIRLNDWPAISGASTLLVTWVPGGMQDKEKRPRATQLPGRQRPDKEPMPDVPPVSLTPESATVPAAGGTGSFVVAMTGEGTSASWTADPQAEASWMHLDAPPAHTPQTADGGVQWRADANSTGVQRTGDIYVNGKTFKLTQFVT